MWPTYWTDKMALAGMHSRRIFQILALVLFVGVAILGADSVNSEVGVNEGAKDGAKDGAWQQAYKVRTRMIVGPNEEDRATRLAFVQLELEPGWKTYWRHPGEAGGIPPEFSWDGSSNLNGATVQYPAPHRMTEEIGDTIGYKKSVIFPVRLTANDPGKPIGLQLALRFGICKDICVPTEAKFYTTVPMHASQSLPIEFRAALDTVPRAQLDLRPQDPMLQTVKAAKREGKNWRIGFATKHQNGAREADLFLEAPGGLFIPLPKKTPAVAGPMKSFEITLSESEYQDLRGKPLQATVVDSLGASEAEFVVR